MYSYTVAATYLGKKFCLTLASHISVQKLVIRLSDIWFESPLSGLQNGLFIFYSRSFFDGFGKFKLARVEFLADKYLGKIKIIIIFRFLLRETIYRHIKFC